jgi:uncharacterized membrane protein
VIAVAALLLTSAWVVLIVAAPALPGWAGAIVYGFASLVCHQLPERSFHLGGFQLAVCARCLGIYAGAWGGVAAFTWIRSTADVPAARIPPRSARRLAAVAAVPTLLTVALEMVGVWHPSNVTRALAGAPLGALVALMVMNALATLHYDECAPPRPTVPKPPQRSI